jgi:hypothetical protein
LQALYRWQSIARYLYLAWINIGLDMRIVMHTRVDTMREDSIDEEVANTTTGKHDFEPEDSSSESVN